MKKVIQLTIEWDDEAVQFGETLPTADYRRDDLMEYGQKEALSKMSEGIYEGQLEYTCEEAAEYTGFWSIEVSDDSEPETGLCVYCLNYDTELTEAQGVYGVGKCCSEEHSEYLGEELKTSEEWMNEAIYGVLEIDSYDGWDLENFDYSFKDEKITETEFQRRVNASKVKGVDK